MIRINLLSEGRRPVVARKSKARLSMGDQDPSALILGAGLVLGLLVAGVWWYLVNSQVQEMNERIRAAQLEMEELKPIIAKVEEFKAAKADLENKIAVIKDLKRKQQGPVRIMDAISRALPDLLWLDSMSVQGTSVTLRGSAFNTNAVASFLENLNQVPEFKEPDTKDVQATQGGEAFSFHIDFTFEQQIPPEEAVDDVPLPEG